MDPELGIPFAVRLPVLARNSDESTVLDPKPSKKPPNLTSHRNNALSSNGCWSVLTCERSPIITWFGELGVGRTTPCCLDETCLIDPVVLGQETGDTLDTTSMLSPLISNKSAPLTLCCRPHG